MTPRLDDLLVKWLKGEQEAISLILELHHIVEIWDDLIDLDKPIGPEKINQALYGALIKLPRNQFYARHFGLLSPLLETAILDWLTANAFEATKEQQKLILAYGLRFSILSMTTMAARIIGGFEWAVKVNTEFRALGEPWSAYSTEHGVT